MNKELLMAEMQVAVTRNEAAMTRMLIAFVGALGFSVVPTLCDGGVVLIACFAMLAMGYYVVTEIVTSYNQRKIIEDLDSRMRAVSVR